MPHASQPFQNKNVFLSAEWRDLVMLNYEVSPLLLQPYVPRGTELDSFEGKTFVSLVGFVSSIPSSSEYSQFPFTLISTK
jgi:uncharacterized protein YqjF (DUF2071 family)